MSEETKERKKKALKIVSETAYVPTRLIAQKNFTISHNEYVRHIKKGDDLSDVPEKYHANLRTEGVLGDSKDS